MDTENLTSSSSSTKSGTDSVQKMDIFKVGHIIGEIVILSAVFYYLNNKVKMMHNEVHNLKKQLDEQQQHITHHITTIYTIIEQINKERKNINMQLSKMNYNQSNQYQQQHRSQPSVINELRKRKNNKIQNQINQQLENPSVRNSNKNVSFFESENQSAQSMDTIRQAVSLDDELDEELKELENDQPDQYEQVEQSEQLQENEEENNEFEETQKQFKGTNRLNNQEHLKKI